jgi:hypothetical protein
MYKNSCRGNLKNRYQLDEYIRMDLKAIQREGMTQRSDVVNTVMHSVFPKGWGMSSLPEKLPRSLMKDRCRVLFPE